MATLLDYPEPVGVTAATQIAFVEGVLGLSDADLGALFAVRRQAVAGWRKAGLPPERAAGMDRLVELAQFLQRRLVPARIPTIVRTPARGLDDKTMLDVLRADGIEPIYLYFARLASYANA